tara:strand:+ start:11631 stop:12491 length:861 start_codon:yes stop_codon:yes gene_type:complete
MILLVAGLVSHANRYHSHNQTNHDAGHEQAELAPDSVVPDAVTQETTANDRQEARDEADLAAQLRMAGAAQKTFYVGLLSTFLLAATVVFAGLAWHAAADGAKAAWNSVETARDIGQAQSRAYLHVPAARIAAMSTGNALAPPSFYAYITIKNEGTTLAKKVEVFYKLALDYRDYDRTVWSLDDPRRVFIPNIAGGQSPEWILGPHLNGYRERMKLENAKVPTVLGAKLHFRVWGEVHYSDIHHRRFKSAFQFETVFPAIEESKMLGSSVNLPVFEEVEDEKQAKD